MLRRLLSHLAAARSSQRRAREQHAHLQRAIAASRSGDLGAAREAYERALAADDPDAELRLSYAGLLERANDAAAAEQQYELCLGERPDWAPPYVNYGALALRLGEWKKALRLLEVAVSLAPDLAEAHANLARVRAHLHESSGPDGARIAKALALPHILESSAEIDQVRAQLADDIERLRGEGLRLSDPPAEVGITAFYLAYHGRNDRALQEGIAALHLEACPELAWTAPHCSETAPRGNRIRVGIVSAYLYEHSIGRV